MKSLLYLTHTHKAQTIVLEQLMVYYFKFNLSTTFTTQLVSLGFEYNTQLPVSLTLENLNSFFLTGPLIRNKEYIIPELSIKEINPLKTTAAYLNIQKSKLAFNTFFKLIDIYKQINPISNSLYLMSLVGAKSNWSQIKQLLGVRGYTSNARGYLYKIPIMESFSKGLNLYEYFLSCYGARKGIIDTALKTADAGYLTRRLVENCQDFVIKEYFCNTTNYSLVNHNINTKGGLELPLIYFLWGKILAKNYINKTTGILYFPAGTVLTLEKIKLISRIKPRAPVYTYNTSLCVSGRTICNTCYGFRDFKTISLLGISAGVIAGQSIGEPGTQLVLRTFHTGGVFYTKNKPHVDGPVDISLYLTAKDTNKLAFNKLCSLNFIPNYISKYNVYTTEKEGCLQTIKTNPLQSTRFSHRKMIIKFIDNKVKNISLVTFKFTNRGYLLKNSPLQSVPILKAKQRFDIFSNETNESYIRSLTFTEIMFKNMTQLIFKNNNSNWAHISLSTSLIYFKPYLPYLLLNKFGVKFNFSSNKYIFNINMYSKTSYYFTIKTYISNLKAYNKYNIALFLYKLQTLTSFKQFYSKKNKSLLLNTNGRLLINRSF